MDNNDRRQNPRFRKDGQFSVHGAEPGAGFSSNAQDQGPGGAFLITKRSLRKGSRLILEAHEPLQKGPPVLLVAEVVRSREVPTPGVGVRWRMAIALDGYERLRCFLDLHFHLMVDPQKIGAHSSKELQGPVQYDFMYGSVEPVAEEKVKRWTEADQFFGVDYPQAFLPKLDFILTRVREKGARDSRSSARLRREQGMDLSFIDRNKEWSHEPSEEAGPSTQRIVTAPVGEVAEASYRTGPITQTGMGESTITSLGTEEDKEQDAKEWLDELRRRKRLRLPVQLTAAGQRFTARARYISSEALFMVMEDDADITRGERVIVHFPCSLGNRSVELVMVGLVKRRARDRRTNRWGVDVVLQSVDEGKYTGIFEEYIKAL